MARHKLQLKYVENKKERTTKFKKRISGLRKMASNLSTLCGIEVLLICFGVNGEVETYPEDKSNLKSVISRYQNITDERKNKHKCNLSSSLTKEIENMKSALLANLSSIVELIDKRIPLVMDRIRDEYEKLHQMNPSALSVPIYYFPPMSTYTGDELGGNGLRNNGRLQNFLPDDYSTSSSVMDLPMLPAADESQSLCEQIYDPIPLMQYDPYTGQMFYNDQQQLVAAAQFHNILDNGEQRIVSYDSGFINSNNKLPSFCRELDTADTVFVDAYTEGANASTTNIVINNVDPLQSRSTPFEEPFDSRILRDNGSSLLDCLVPASLTDFNFQVKNNNVDLLRNSSDQSKHDQERHEDHQHH